MFMAVTFVILIIIIPHGDTIFRTCVPNTQFLLNGRLCYCNSIGHWSEATCQLIGRRQTCQAGQIIWEECSQCICQENGKLLCTNTECSEDGIKKNTTTLDIGAELWCTPFRSYYINCSLCVCPASGKMSEARCATDSSCSLKGPNLSLDLITHNVCIPKVMYLFSCLHCLCSDEGFFDKSKCVETCQKVPESTKRCIPKTFYRVDCNVHHCPDNGIPDNSLRTKSSCKRSNIMSSLVELRNISNACEPNKFTTPRCIYCECNSQGVVNESSCIEQECLKIIDYDYDFVKSTCSPGEIVPTCMECFCPRSGYVMEKYCTRVCSLQNKLIMLERLLKDNISLIDRTAIKELKSNSETCESNSVLLDQGKYCLCPENGNSNFKLCTSVFDDSGPKKTQRVLVDKSSLIDYNITCEPNTFVEFGCNTCYCTKNGKIDQKWCTLDDCEAKETIQLAHRSRILALPSESMGTCVTGSISKVDCNFCICSASGLVKDRACTNNTCSGRFKPIGNEFTCEPSAYYTVDCNICFCASDGIKNVDKCTRNQCETSFLRTDSCASGELFSDDCNICVCPPNGDKKDKACTNRTCAESDTPWKKIFKLSQNLLGNQIAEDTTRNLELCFPGEEFESACKLCVCPEMGIKEYASCTPMLCDDEKPESTSPVDFRGEGLFDEDFFVSEEVNDHGGETDLVGTDRGSEAQEEIILRTRRQDKCMTYNITDSAERQHCTPGSQYIIRCRICICPYMGNINHFCRPMPPEQFCEQAFPNFNYVAMGRRIGENVTLNNSTSSKPSYPMQVKIPHNHTEHKCEEPGKLTDDCYICECEQDHVLIEEHCYKSEDEACAGVEPTFLKANETSIVQRIINLFK